MTGNLALTSLATVVAGVLLMYVSGFQMIRKVNQNPGPEGLIPMSSMLLRTEYLYHPVQRYRTQMGKDRLYRTMQLGWILLGVGLLGILGTSLADHISHR